MGRLRSRLENVERRLGAPSPRAKGVTIWWECREHPGHYTICPFELRPEEAEAIEREHICVPEEALVAAGVRLITLSWDDEKPPRLLDDGSLPPYY